MAKGNKNFFKKKNEWSIVKDRLLECYLKPYLQKILMSHRSIIYIDCFAGKGKFDDGNDGSPLIALKVRDDCLRTTRASKAHIYSVFIELNHADDLKHNISDFHHNGEVLIVSGKFEEEIEMILSSKKGWNVFLYVDPYGIKALDLKLFQGFSKSGFYSIELLINMNSFGFFRDACRVMEVERVLHDEIFFGLDETIVEYDPTIVDSSTQSEILLTNIAGGDYWRDIVLDYKNEVISGYQAERCFSEHYRKMLQKSYDYVLDMPIRLREGQRPKYRMIHATNHVDGCYLMAENMQKRKNELFTNVQGSNQMSFSDLDSSLSVSMDDEFISRESIMDKLIIHMQTQESPIRLNKFIATFFNEYGLLCDFKVIHNIFEELECRDEIIIKRFPPLTKKGRESKFWEDKGETQKIFIEYIT